MISYTAGTTLTHLLADASPRFLLISPLLRTSKKINTPLQEAVRVRERGEQRPSAAPPWARQAAQGMKKRGGAVQEVVNAITSKGRGNQRQ